MSRKTQMTATTRGIGASPDRKGRLVDVTGGQSQMLFDENMNIDMSDANMIDLMAAGIDTGSLIGSRQFTSDSSGRGRLQELK